MVAIFRENRKLDESGWGKRGGIIHALFSTPRVLIKPVCSKPQLQGELFENSEVTLWSNDPEFPVEHDWDGMILHDDPNLFIVKGKDGTKISINVPNKLFSITI